MNPEANQNGRYRRNYLSGKACAKCGASLDGCVVTHSTSPANPGLICVLMADGSHGCNWPSEPEKQAKAQSAMGLASATSATSNVMAARPSSSDPLTQAIVNAVEPILAERLRTQVDEDRVLELVEQCLSNIPAKTLRVETVGGTNTVNGYRHKHFEPLLKLANLKLDVLIYGPAGGGKTTVISQIAQALSAKYYAMSLDRLASRTALVGYQTQDGAPTATQFRSWFLDGGVFALEEVGACSGNLAVSLNTALDNGICAFPGEVEPSRRASDAVLIATDNSNLAGADQLYNGRQAQDAAFRERFVFWKWDYDERLEELIALGKTDRRETRYQWTPDITSEQWVANVFALRAGMKSEKLEGRIVISPRASIKGSLLAANGFPAQVAEDMVIWKGLDVDTVERVRRAASNHGYVTPKPNTNWVR